MNVSSLVFFEKVDPQIATPETRVLSAALHAICSVLAVREKVAAGCTAAELDAFVARPIVAHIVALWREGGNCAIADLMDVANRHGLTLCPSLDPTVSEVIQ